MRRLLNDIKFLKYSLFRHTSFLWLFSLDCKCCLALGVPDRESHLFPLSSSWKSLYCIVHYLVQGQASSFNYSADPVEGLVFLASCNKWRLDLSDVVHFSASFQWRRFLLHWEDSIEGIEHHFQILASSQPYFDPYNIVFFQICVISIGRVAGWFNTPFGELIF